MVLMITMTFFDKVIHLIMMFISYDLYIIPHVLSFTTFAVFLGYGKVNVATYKDIIDTIYLF